MDGRVVILRLDPSAPTGGRPARPWSTRSTAARRSRRPRCSPRSSTRRPAARRSAWRTATAPLVITPLVKGDHEVGLLRHPEAPHRRRDGGRRRCATPSWRPRSSASAWRCSSALGLADDALARRLRRLRQAALRDHARRPGRPAAAARRRQRRGRRPGARARDDAGRAAPPGAGAARLRRDRVARAAHAADVARGSLELLDEDLDDGRPRPGRGPRAGRAAPGRRLRRLQRPGDRAAGPQPPRRRGRGALRAGRARRARAARSPPSSSARAEERRRRARGRRPARARAGRAATPGADRPHPAHPARQRAALRARRAAPSASTPAYRGPNATITVDDAGPGVPADEGERIFERFQRGSRTRRRGRLRARPGHRARARRRQDGDLVLRRPGRRARARASSCAWPSSCRPGRADAARA